jgi:hypothetical protein
MVPRVLHKRIGPQQHVAIKASRRWASRSFDTKTHSLPEFSHRRTGPEHASLQWTGRQRSDVHKQVDLPLAGSTPMNFA